MGDDKISTERRRRVITRFYISAAFSCFFIAIGFAYYTQQHVFINAAEKSIINGMKDTSSVIFRNVVDCPHKGWVKGEINAKNSFGALVGFKHFYSNGDETFLDGESNYPDEYGIDAEIHNYERAEDYSKKCGDGMDKFYLGISADLITKKYRNDSYR